MYQQSEKNLLSSNISPTCPHNMVNIGPLAAEIISLVWGTPANFNGFRVLAALLHGTLLVGVSQTAVLNRGRHLYSTGRPSDWALAHISIFVLFFLLFFLAKSQWSQTGCLPYFYTWYGPSANLECRPEMCYMQLAGNAGLKKSPSAHHCETLSSCIFATKARIDNQKKVVKQHISSTCPHNMANFSPLTAEIGWQVSGIPANFNRFRILASLLQSRRSP